MFPPANGAAAKTVDDYQCLPGVRLYGESEGAGLPWYAVSGLNVANCENKTTPRVTVLPGSERPRTSPASCFGRESVYPHQKTCVCVIGS